LRRVRGDSDETSLYFLLERWSARKGLKGLD
jgi:hypothetical protein